MRRGAFITLLGGAAAWSITARAQQPAMRVIGLLTGASLDGVFACYVAKVRLGLKNTSFAEDQNVPIESRAAACHPERLPELAADFVRRQVAMIAPGRRREPGPSSQKDDFVNSNRVRNRRRRGREPSCQELQSAGRQRDGREFHHKPARAQTSRLALRAGPAGNAVRLSRQYPQFFRSRQARPHCEAQSLAANSFPFLAGTQPEIDQAFASMAQQHTGGLWLAWMPAQHPAESDHLGIMQGAALMTYGSLAEEILRPASVNAGQHPQGRQYGDAPIQFRASSRCPTTAKAMGLKSPETFLLRADEQIE